MDHRSQILMTVISFHMVVASLPVAAFILWMRPNSWHYAFGFFLGIFTGFVNLQSNEVQLPALLVLSFGFFLSFSQPQRFWRWALLVAAWIPLSELSRPLFVQSGGALENYSFSGSVVGSCVVFILSFVGCATGAFIRQHGPNRIDPDSRVHIKP